MTLDDTRDTNTMTLQRREKLNELGFISFSSSRQDGVLFFLLELCKIERKRTARVPWCLLRSGSGMEFSEHKMEIR